MARFDKLPKFKVPKVSLPRRKAEAGPEAPPEPLEAAPPEPQPGMRFTPLEFRPVDAAPRAREGPAVEAAPLTPAPPPAAEPLAEVAAVEETARAAPPAAFEPAPGPTVAGQPVENVEGIGPVFGEKLRAEGVATIEELIAADADHLARRTGISANLLAKWQAMGRLQAVNGIGPQYSELLFRVGIATLHDLARWEPNALAEKCNAYQDELGTPAEGNRIGHALAERWIEGARAIVGIPPPLPPPEVAPEPAPAAAAIPPPEPAAAPKPRFALPFGRKSKPEQAIAPAEASDVKPASRFSLSLGRKKEAPAPEAAAAPEPPKERSLGFTFGRKKAEAPTEAADAPAAPRKLGFTLGRKKPEAVGEAAPVPEKRRGFQFGGRKPAKAEAPPPPPAPDPMHVAALPESAEAAKTVSITLPVPPSFAPAPPDPEPQPAPVAAREPVHAAPLPPVLPRIAVDFDYMHLRVDRILSDRSPYRAAPVPDPRGVDQRVDDLLGSKKAKRAKTPAAREK